MNYKEDVVIDIDNLEREWLKQPQLIMEYYEAMIEADEKKNILANRISIKDAELDSDIRYVLAKEGRFTEAMVKAEIVKNKERQKLIEELDKKNKNHAVLKAAIIALEHKKRALENLCQLWMAGYFGTPVEKRAGISTKAEIKDRLLNKAQNTQRSAINKRR